MFLFNWGNSHFLNDRIIMIDLIDMMARLMGVDGLPGPPLVLNYCINGETRNAATCFKEQEC
jgi:hypothetical protein